LSPPSYLDPVLDFARVVSDDEGGLHDGGELDVAVPFMLPLELVQQGLIGGLGEAGAQREALVGRIGGNYRSLKMYFGLSDSSHRKKYVFLGWIRI